MKKIVVLVLNNKLYKQTNKRNVREALNILLKYVIKRPTFILRYKKAPIISHIRDCYLLHSHCHVTRASLIVNTEYVNNYVP